MSDRPRFFDDIAGVAGGAISALAGLREEGEAMLRARLDELIQRLDLVRRDELDAMRELAANARTGQEAAETRLATLETRLAALEARVATLEAANPVPSAAAHIDVPQTGARHTDHSVSPAISPEIGSDVRPDVSEGS